MRLHIRSVCGRILWQIVGGRLSSIIGFFDIWPAME
jgi:hypothetical protein